MTGQSDTLKYLLAVLRCAAPGENQHLRCRVEDEDIRSLNNQTLGMTIKTDQVTSVEMLVNFILNNDPRYHSHRW